MNAPTNLYAAPALVPYFYAEFADGSSYQIEKNNLDEVYDAIDRFYEEHAPDENVADVGLIWDTPGRTTSTDPGVPTVTGTITCHFADPKALQTFFANVDDSAALLRDIFENKAGDPETFSVKAEEPYTPTLLDRFAIGVCVIEEAHDFIATPTHWPRWARRLALATAPFAGVVWLGSFMTLTGLVIAATLGFNAASAVSGKLISFDYWWNEEDPD